MGGGLMQLVAYGAQDVYLTGNPQITFFKVVYRRHTNFSTESIQQTLNGTVGFGNRVSCTVSRNGDLVSACLLEVNLPALGGTDSYMARVGERLIEEVEVEIGGQVIDRQYGEWMTIWTDLTNNQDKATLLNKLKGTRDQDDIDNEIFINTGSVPLQFWFCRNPGLALPLIALQYHEVKININFRPASSTKLGMHENDKVTVWCDYIFLDTDERRRFAQVSHEYLIEQVQFSNKLTATPGSNQVELRFNHPVKELVWAVANSSKGDGATAMAAGSQAGATATQPPAGGVHGGDVTVTDALLQLNGHDRFKRRSGPYFTQQQRYQYHSGSSGNGNIHVYSFALKPEEHQPSGTCNFSRIDNAVLNFTCPDSDGESNADDENASVDATGVSVYAVNYNVLRIMSGMGGLAYSN